jgi:hypothetical protein
MKTLSLVCALVFTSALVVAGCRKDASAPPLKSTDSPTAPPQARAQSQHGSNDLIVRIRKLGGPGGKQVLNELSVPTPLGDDFNVTEQVGATQLAFSGKVEDLRNGEYRVRYKYTETSAAGVKFLDSLVELPLDHEKELGGLKSAEGEETETVVLGLSRP